MEVTIPILILIYVLDIIIRDLLQSFKSHDTEAQIDRLETRLIRLDDKLRAIGEISVEVLKNQNKDDD
tara:strand:+ start:38 stop:241 length:204 start_codon:yes stop_codon:yes gene_type:complete